MTATAAPAAPKGRLGNGQLRRQVAEYLTDHPGPCKTGEIAKALDRSAGAVGNALTTLAGRGQADRDPGKPVRYWANSATAAAITTTCQGALRMAGTGRSGKANKRISGAPRTQPAIRAPTTKCPDYGSHPAVITKRAMAGRRPRLPGPLRREQGADAAGCRTPPLWCHRDPVNQGGTQDAFTQGNLWRDFQ